MLTALEVFVGGAIGGLLRYGCTRWLGSRGGVLVANLVACYVLGLSTLLSFHPALVATGLAGALSTWSTLAKETGLLIQKHQWRALFWFAGAHIGGGLLAMSFAHRTVLGL